MYLKHLDIQKIIYFFEYFSSNICLFKILAHSYPK